jgi:MoaA/NifB/PqqE/SkfB family radical SAM enzyme
MSQVPVFTAPEDFRVTQDPAVPLRVVPKDGYYLSNVKSMCRRGVMWLGQVCNLRCYFCYFIDKIADGRHPEHPFMSLEKAQGICKRLVEVYGNNAIDIQGGEPSVAPYIYDLIGYCDDIGLKPTLITNALVYEKRDDVRRLRDAGIFDLLISVHGIGEVYDRVVGKPGASEKQMRAIDNLAEMGVPFRFNLTLTREVLTSLGDVAALAVSRGARAVNFIAFNPFIDQNVRRDEGVIPRYADQVATLLPVIDYLSAHDIEVNVRYMPFCLFPEPYRKHVQNFQQIIYDLHEWESAGEIWSGNTDNRIAARPLPELIHIDQRLGPWGQLIRQRLGIEDDAPRYLDELGEVPGFTELEYKFKEYRVQMTKLMHPYEKHPDKCGRCSLRGICDGFHRDYAQHIGFGEARPLESEAVVFDPRHYQRHQLKVIEAQEAPWVFRDLPGAEPVPSERAEAARG